MKAKHLSIVVLVTALAGAGAARAAGDYVPTISVAKTAGTAGPYNPHWQPAMGEGLAQMMITELGRLKTFRVLESVALDDLREERKLGENGEVAADKAVTKGGWEAADYTLKTTVTRFGAKKSSYGGGGFHLPVHLPGGGGFRVDSSEHEVQIDWRIIDNQSREVVAQGRGEGKESGKGFSFGSWVNHGYSRSSEFMDSALGKATMKAIEQIAGQVRDVKLNTSKRVEAVAQREKSAADAKSAARQALKQVRGEVLLVESDGVVVSLGSAHGFTSGDAVTVYRVLRKTNKAGKEIVMHEPAGELTLTSVRKNQSHARPKAGAKIEEGWVVADASYELE